MPQLPDHIGLRREQSRARLRRRRVRQRRAVALAGLLIVAVALVGASGGGSGAPPRVHHRRVSSISVPARAAVARPRRLSALEARGVATIRKLAALGLPVYCGGRRGNAVAFTFDDGPGVYTHYALKKLAEARERATFFAVGKSIDAFPGYLPRELEVAAIGDHTFTHSDLIALSAAQITSEIERTRGLIQRQTGQPVVLFRPPYGAHNSVVDGILKRLGLLEIMWSVDSADSLGANYAGIIRNASAACIRARSSSCTRTEVRRSAR